MAEHKTDTIAAVATPMGVGGIGVIRISGSDAVAAADRIFKTPSGARLADAKSHTIHYGHITDPETGDIIDEAMAAVMLAPRTFTAEDVVEISVHGSPVVLQKTLLLIINTGVRMAQAGEFTKRAFINGRVDLARAEAVLDVIHADSDISLKNAISQLEGGLSREIEQIRTPLLYLAAQFAAAVDYPDDDIADITDDSLRKTLRKAADDCEKLLDGAASGRIAKEGLRCVLAGRPNVGKSSLLNALTKSERAIVTDVAGTTRDVIEESIIIDGIAVRLFDTAGLRDTTDLVEKIGVDRTMSYIDGADLVLLVLDGSQPRTDEDIQLLKSTAHKPRIIILNKSDLAGAFCADDIDGEDFVRVSASVGSGIDTLKKRIGEHCLSSTANGAALVSNLRHTEALKAARESLVSAIDALDTGMPTDMCSIDISAALESLGLITGASVSADIVDKIFSEFCVGK